MPIPSPRTLVLLVPAAALAIVACGLSDSPGPTGVEATNSSARLESAAIISDCGRIITRSGEYRLVNDLANCQGYGIRVLTSNVGLRLDGHTIAGAPNSVTGIVVGTGVKGGVSNVRIYGPATIQSFTNGIEFEQVTHSKLVGVTVRSNFRGLAFNRSWGTGDLVASSEDSILNNTFANNDTHGVTINGGANSVFAGNTSTHNGYSPFGGHGFYIYDASGIILIDNRASENATHGIDVNQGTTNSVIVENTARYNRVQDLWDGNIDCYSDTWERNTFGTAWPSCIH